MFVSCPQCYMQVPVNQRLVGLVGGVHCPSCQQFVDVTPSVPTTADVPAVLPPVVAATPKIGLFATSRGALIVAGGAAALLMVGLSGLVIVGLGAAWIGSVRGAAVPTSPGAESAAQLWRLKDEPHGDHQRHQ